VSAAGSDSARRAAVKVLGAEGRLLTPRSKASYREMFPGHVYVPNGCVCLRTHVIWRGDLDLSTSDAVRLLQLAAELDESLYVLHEADGPAHDLLPPIARALAAFHPNGAIYGLGT
jgi:hypothetical protein